MRKAFGIVRIAAAMASVIALIGDINFTIGTGPFAIANFFSYFTVQSMMLGIAVFGLAAFWALEYREDPLWLDITRVLSTTYMIVSGIVFSVILIEGTMRGVPVWAPWSSLMLHFWIPAYALIDWLIAPGRDAPWTTVNWVMLFPAVWIVFTMIRGSAVYWYPYFFLDPALVEFPWEFSLYLLAIVIIFCGTLATLIGISRLPRLEHVRARFSLPRSARGLRTVRGLPKRLRSTSGR